MYKFGNAPPIKEKFISISIYKIYIKNTIKWEEFVTKNNNEWMDDRQTKKNECRERERETAYTNR